MRPKAGSELDKLVLDWRGVGRGLFLNYIPLSRTKDVNSELCERILSSKLTAVGALSLALRGFTLSFSNCWSQSFYLLARRCAGVVFSLDRSEGGLYDMGAFAAQYCH